MRPPGHHAGTQGLLEGASSCGFCIFNSVAAGAFHAISTHRAQRVAIVDLDVHHGNGTEEIVKSWHDPSQLFFFSSHLYDVEPGKYEFYPGSGADDNVSRNIINAAIAPMWARERDAQNSGSGSSSTRTRGASKASGGATAPPPQKLAGREEWRRQITQRLLPPLHAFNPDLILISAGFDAGKVPASQIAACQTVPTCSAPLCAIFLCSNSN